MRKVYIRDHDIFEDNVIIVNKNYIAYQYINFKTI